MDAVDGPDHSDGTDPRDTNKVSPYVMCVVYVCWSFRFITESERSDEYISGESSHPPTPSRHSLVRSSEANFPN